MDKINPVLVKNLTYYPIIIGLASLRPDSEVYTLNHEISLCCKICKKVRCYYGI